MWPILVLGGLQLLSLGIELEQHGKPNKGTANAWVAVLSIVMFNLIMYWGGWFEPLFR